MVARLNFSLDGVEEFDAILGLAIDAVTDPRKPHEAIHDELNKEAYHAFMRGRPMFVSGPKWKGYDDEPNYRGYKRGILFGDRPRGTPQPRRNMAVLRWTTGAQSSPWTDRERLGPSFAFLNDPAHVWINTRTGFDWGTSLPYAAQHQHGGGYQRWDGIPVPRRPIVGPLSIAARKIVRVYQAWIEAHIGIAAARRSPSHDQLRRVFAA